MKSEQQMVRYRRDRDDHPDYSQLQVLPIEPRSALIVALATLAMVVFVLAVGSGARPSCGSPASASTIARNA